MLGQIVSFHNFKHSLVILSFNAT